MITFDNVGKAFRRRGEIQWVFRNLSVSFPRGENVGVLAPESAGKTTLVNLVTGRDNVSEGAISRSQEVSWPFGDRGTFSNRLSGKQNLRFLTDVYGRPFNEAMDFVADFAEIGRQMSSPIRTYTGEMRNRLAVSTLFAMKFDYIVVDDSMDFGDAIFRRKVANYLVSNNQDFTLFIATANPALIAKYCQKAAVLNKGSLTMCESVPEAVELFNQVNT
jgi:capsular polysaccharide transport system ATP-binding protein